MTELQIRAQQLKEERRHNLATENLQNAQNQYNKEHYERSDTITGEHYNRSDTAGLISANASAMNAETQRLQYQLQHDIEYLPTYTVDGNSVEQVILGYGSGLPLSAQKKIAEIEQLTLNAGIVTVPDVVTNNPTDSNIVGYNRDAKGNWSPAKLAEMRTSKNEYVTKQGDVLNASIIEKYASSAGKALTGLSSLATATFGKGGIINTIRDLE